MHPGFFGWWKHARGRGCDSGAEASCGPGAAPWRQQDELSASDDDGGTPFGVRRPLRFLAFRLGLDDKQVSELARVLSDLKIERAQAAVDTRRAVTALADLISGDSFDAGKAAAVAAERAKSAERLNAAIAKALASIHGLVNAEQRGRLATLIRTGTLQI